MNHIFTPENLKPGYILSCSTSTPYGALIRLALSNGFHELQVNHPGRISQCPNHDMICIPIHGTNHLAESVIPIALARSLPHVSHLIQTRKMFNIRIFRPTPPDPTVELAAAEYWKEHILHSPYDCPGIAFLGYKWLFGLASPHHAAGLKCARWCTEGIAEAYHLGTYHDVYHKINPTPLTTVKRWLDGKLELVDSIYCGSAP